MSEAIILVAMDEEAEPFLAKATAASEPRSVGNALQWDLELGGHDVVLVRTGVGLINAAGGLTAAILRTLGDEPLVISAGSAGGLGAEVRVGDVVIGEEYVQTDADARAFGYAMGQVPGMPERYSGDAAALATDVSVPEVVVRRGLIVSSDTFVSGDHVERVRGHFSGALATDMESVSLAQTAHVHGLRFVSVRGISDLCAPGEFEAHVDDAADRSAAVVLALLDALA
ncbi:MULTISPECIES: 5'-methylthioadenosine/S-adenosylhomocysteine nucleosidase [unclassified Rathayibacter]|uniref:5'-methylthioadenosine/S-adenosylhomocysteine nucleosidase n=1 Tax=unclassified Rathayibacter TaxID=2609250 RepID=UPI001F166F1F|nr:MULTISPECIES: 5'-methylthioadenosine/S-adenosylhomocysteine nucleosidase [unclassified Rathayibacter]